MSPALADGFFTTSATWEIPAIQMQEKKINFKIMVQGGLQLAMVFSSARELERDGIGVSIHY